WPLASQLRQAQTERAFETFAILSLRLPTAELDFSQTQRIHANILPVPCLCIVQASRHPSEVYSRKSERRDHPSRRTHRLVEIFPSTCTRQDFGASPSALEARLAAPETHSIFPSRLLLSEVPPTFAVSWARLQALEPSIA